MSDKKMPEKLKPGWLFEQGAKRYGKFILLSVVALYLASLVVCLLVALIGRHSAGVIVLSGSFWLGALIGLLLGFFVQEAPKWDQKALAASVGAVAGSGILLLLRYLEGVGVDEIWFYPMGLVGGFIIGTIWELADPPD